MDNHNNAPYLRFKTLLLISAILTLINSGSIIYMAYINQIDTTDVELQIMGNNIVVMIRDEPYCTIEELFLPHHVNQHKLDQLHIDTYTLIHDMWLELINKYKNFYNG